MLELKFGDKVLVLRYTRRNELFCVTSKNTPFVEGNRYNAKVALGWITELVK
jgi:hypothetical protein